MLFDQTRLQEYSILSETLLLPVAAFVAVVLVVMVCSFPVASHHAILGKLNADSIVNGFLD